MKKIFIICKVREDSVDYISKLQKYTKKLERKGHQIHLPHRDTYQKGSSLEINLQNFSAIYSADEVHIFYNSKSQGTHFDLGVSFALKKKIVIVENEVYNPSVKSYAKFLDEYVEFFNKKN